MVSPQHFQQQAAYAAWSAECIARLGLSHPWGVINATFEPDVLKLGRLPTCAGPFPLARTESPWQRISVDDG